MVDKKSTLFNYLRANVIVMPCDGVILNPLYVSFATLAWPAVSNSTKAMSQRPGTKRTSL